MSNMSVLCAGKPAGFCYVCVFDSCDVHSSNDIKSSLMGQIDEFISPSQELFVEMIAKDALVYAQQGKRKTLQRKDLGK